MSKNVMEKAGTGSEPFLSTFMKPMKKDVDLPTEVLELPVEYYCNAYEYAFATVSNIHTSSEDSIVILSKVNQFSRLRVGAESLWIIIFTKIYQICKRIILVRYR